MKKIILSFVAIASLFTSCVKENPTVELPGVVSRSFTAIAPEAVKSQYTPGEGVTLNGTEDISVYWCKSDAVNFGNGNGGRIIARATTPFEYSFSHSAIAGAESYDYYFVSPNTVTNNQMSSNRYPLVYLNTIQQPAGVASFDPAQDYYAGQPLFDQVQSASAEVNFKRLFYPLIVALKDKDSVLGEGQKIQYVTLASKTAATTYNPIVGSAYLQFVNADGQKSDEITDVKIQSWLAASAANKVTAYYPQGQAFSGEEFDAWLMVNIYDKDFKSLSSVLAGEYALTVVADNVVYERAVNFGTGVKFSHGINKVTLNGLGEKVSNAYTQDFTSLAALATSLKASDGATRTWGFENVTLDKGTGLNLAKDKAHVISLPQVSTERITKIAILPGLKASNNGTAVIFNLMAGEEVAVANINLNIQKALKDAPKGFIEVEVPADYQDKELKLVRVDQTPTYIRAITVYYEGEGPGPGPEPTEKTYSQMYEEGIEFTVGDIVVNKTNYPTVNTLAVATVTPQDFKKACDDGGLVILQGEGTVTLSGAPSYNSTNGGLVLVGDNPKVQPVINLTDDATKLFFACRCPGGSYGFKNLNVVSKGATTDYVFLTDDKAGTIKTLNIEDCTIETTCNVIQESDKKGTLETVTVNNCVINLCAGKQRAIFNTTVNTTTYPDKVCTTFVKATITNNVFYSSVVPSTFAHFVMQLQSVNPYVNLEFAVNNNTFYNFWNNGGLVNMFTVKAGQFNNNVIEFDYTGVGSKQCYVYNYRKTDDDPKVTFPTANNWGYAANADEQRIKVFVTAKNAEKSGSSNWTLSASPYSTIDVANGYFPVNTSVVTTSAGADYSTKLWRNWGE